MKRLVIISLICTLPAQAVPNPHLKKAAKKIHHVLKISGEVALAVVFIGAYTYAKSH